MPKKVIAEGNLRVSVIEWDTDVGSRYALRVDADPPVTTGVLTYREVQGLLAKLGAR